MPSLGHYQTQAEEKKKKKKASACGMNRTHNDVNKPPRGATKKDTARSSVHKERTQFTHKGC